MAARNKPGAKHDDHSVEVSGLVLNKYCILYLFLIIKKKRYQKLIIAEKSVSKDFIFSNII